MHVGLIVDGARRWARKEAVPLRRAYAIALEGVDALVRQMFDNGVVSVSVYLLSRDNLQRAEDELDAVFDATADYLAHDAAALAEEYGAGFAVAGDIGSVPDRYRSAAEALVRAAPAAGAPRRIYLLIAYSPAEELAACWRPGLETMAALVSELWVPERVDLVIRTGGGALLSDFLPLQSGYARLWTTTLLFPELTWEAVAQPVCEVRDSTQLRGR